MSRIAYSFFALAALCGLAGMGWGIWMGINQDFATAPAHAHLNLLGWLGLSVMGGFHALAGGAVPRGLARLNFALSAIGAIMLPAGIAGILTGHHAAEPLAVIGGMVAIAGMATFVTAILIGWRRAAA